MNGTAEKTTWATRINHIITRLAGRSNQVRATVTAAQADQPNEEEPGGFWTGFSRQPSVERPDLPASGKPLNILLPVDFSEGSAQVLDCALRMAASHPTRIMLVHAINLNLIPHGPANVAEQKVALCREAISKAEPFIAAANHVGATAACMLDDGPPAAVITRAIKRCRPDLVIMSKAKKVWPLRWLGQGTIQRAVRESECPVLVVPAF